MMEEESAYAVVTQNDCDIDDEACDAHEMNEDEAVRLSLEIPTTPTFLQSSKLKMGVLLVAVFGLGALVGTTANGLAAARSTLNSGNTRGSNLTMSSDSCNCSNVEETSVSYAFLKTERGASLLTDCRQELTDNGVEAALRKLFNLIEVDDQVASSCHPFAHQLGRLSLDSNGFDDAWGGLVGTDDAWLLRICNAAFMHGIIEHYLGHSTSLQEDVSMIDKNICQHLDNVASGKWECHHGLGHGVMQNIRNEHDLQALNDGLEACHATALSHDCENGLWMDYFASTRNGGELEPESLQVCHSLAQKTWDCAIYSPTEFLLHNPRQYKEAIAFCNDGLRSVDPNLAKTCVAGVGMQTSKENQHDFVHAEDACRTAFDYDQQQACMREALGYYTMTTGKPKFPRSLCEPLKIYQKLCHDYSE